MLKCQIHVCLISAQSIPNLVPLFHEKPDRAIFLTSPEMKDQARRLQRIVKPRGIRGEIVAIKAYDFAAVMDTCQGIIDNTSDDCDLTLNVTGGTKVSALAAFQCFYFSNKRVIYLNTATDELLQLAPVQESLKLDTNLIKVKDYLAGYGFTMQSNGKPSPGFEKRQPHLRSLAELLVNDTRLLGQLNGAITRYRNRAGHANIPLNSLGDKGNDLAAVFERCGVASRTGGNRLNIPSEDTLFFCQGGWLEEYVFHYVKALHIKGLDPAINAEVVWSGAGRKKTTNEFDVLFTWGNRLHVISCKTANPDLKTAGGTRSKEALYELDTLADKVGGLYGRAMLVSARRLSDYDYSRAAKMKIKVVDGRKVLDMKQQFFAWLR